MFSIIGGSAEHRQSVDSAKKVVRMFTDRSFRDLVGEYF
jgi:hypothetical protein